MIPDFQGVVELSALYWATLGMALTWLAVHEVPEFLVKAIELLWPTSGILSPHPQDGHDGVERIKLARLHHDATQIPTPMEVLSRAPDPLLWDTGQGSLSIPLFC